MNCCMLDGGDGDSAAFCETKIIRARKAHNCYECGEPIARGERYECVSGLWDGRFDRFSTCLGCVDVRTVFACDGSWIFGQLWEDVYSSELFHTLTAHGCAITGGAGEDGENCLAGLAPIGRAKLNQMYLDWYLDDDGHQAREAWQTEEERAYDLQAWLRDNGAKALACAYAPPWAIIRPTTSAYLDVPATEAI